MVRLDVNGIACRIKTKWGEVDVKELIKCKDFRDELKCLTDLPHSIIDKAKEEQLWPFYTCISFIDDLENVLLPEVEVCKVPHQSYAKLERAKERLKVGKPYQRIVGVALAYYPEEKGAERLISMGVSLVKQISVFLSSYQDMAEDVPDAKKVQAGLDELTAFGHFGTVYSLAGHDILKVQQIYEMQALHVYTALHYSWREDKFKERYFKILHP